MNLGFVLFPGIRQPSRDCESNHRELRLLGYGIRSELVLPLTLSRCYGSEFREWRVSEWSLEDPSFQFALEWRFPTSSCSVYTLMTIESLGDCYQALDFVVIRIG